MKMRPIVTVLRQTGPVRLKKVGGHHTFVTPTGKRMRGLTRRLAMRAWSTGVIPRPAASKRTGWKGKGGGRRRGTAVDAQLSRVVNRGVTRPAKGQFRLTQLVLGALAQASMRPLLAQRGVCDASRCIATAIDLLCYNRTSNRLVVIELKCGHGNGRSDVARSDDGACTMRGPLSKVKDTILNRHFAQLAATRELFVRERDTLAQLVAMGVDADVDAILLYVNDEKVETYELHNWWTKRASKLIQDVSVS